MEALATSIDLKRQMVTFRIGISENLITKALSLCGEDVNELSEEGAVFTADSEEEYTGDGEAGEKFVEEKVEKDEEEYVNCVCEVQRRPVSEERVETDVSLDDVPENSMADEDCQMFIDFVERACTNYVNSSGPASPEEVSRNSEAVLGFYRLSENQANTFVTAVK